MSDSEVRPSLIISLIPIIFLVFLLALNVIIFSDDATYGPNQISLLMAAALAGFIIYFKGLAWKKILDGIIQSITSAMGAILILLIIGSLAGTWLLSGVVPAMIYYGLKILDPSIFLFAACIISAIVSLATGSSWSTIATVGVALLAIGKVLGFDAGMIAGAIISGAYFGDKMSPLSDTTNLAPAMSGTDLITHIRYMTITTVPSIIIALIIFLIIGFTIEPSGEIQDINLVLGAIDRAFNINLALFLVPTCVILLIIKRVAALPALFIGTLLGAVFALVFQGEVIENVSGVYNNAVKAGYTAVLKSLYTDISVVTENETVNKLLNTGGMFGMMNTVWLIICAMIFGGVMEVGGMLKTITQVIIGWANSTGSLVSSTAATCIFFNLTASDQYLAIVVPGKMYSNIYRERGLAPQNLSRTLEDSGTVTSVLIPWNTCGAYQSGVLGISTFTYLPFCFFNIISPFMTIFFAYAGIKIARLKK
ncbi:MAG: Na+/H+ antiporter NhaC [Bacteroidota bacterium]